MYSMIFLLIHGLMRRSIRICRRTRVSFFIRNHLGETTSGVFFYRVHHGPVQRVGEELGPRRGDLLDQALYVFAFLLGVDAAFGRGHLGAVQAQALVVVAVVQRDQLPLARLLVGFVVVKLVENAVDGRQLLPLNGVELSRAVCGSWRGKQGDAMTASTSGTTAICESGSGLTQLETEADLGPVLVQRLEVGGVLPRNDDAAQRLVAGGVWSCVPAGRGHGGGGGDGPHGGFWLWLGLL